MSPNHTAGAGDVGNHTSEGGALRGIGKEPRNEQGKEGTQDRGSDRPTVSHGSRPGPATCSQWSHFTPVRHLGLSPHSGGEGTVGGSLRDSRPNGSCVYDFVDEKDPIPGCIVMKGVGPGEGEFTCLVTW